MHSNNYSINDEAFLSLILCIVKCQQFNGTSFSTQTKPLKIENDEKRGKLFAFEICCCRDFNSQQTKVRDIGHRGGYRHIELRAQVSFIAKHTKIHILNVHVLYISAILILCVEILSIFLEWQCEGIIRDFVFHQTEKKHKRVSFTLDWFDRKRAHCYASTEEKKLWQVSLSAPFLSLALLPFLWWTNLHNAFTGGDLARSLSLALPLSICVWVCFFHSLSV